MAAGTTPIYPVAVNRGFGKVIAANTNLDGTGTIVLIFTAGSNGSIVEKIIARHMGTNVASVLRIYANDGGAPGTTTTWLIAELTIAANTLSQTAQSIQTYEILLNPGSGFALKASERLYASTGTVLAAGWMVSTVGAGDY